MRSWQTWLAFFLIGGFFLGVAVIGLALTLALLPLALLAAWWARRTRDVSMPGPFSGSRVSVELEPGRKVIEAEYELVEVERTGTKE